MFAIGAAVLVFVLVACPQSGGGPTKYVLTVQGVNCGTTPSGAVSVDPGVATSISALADAGHIMPGSGIWSVVSGTASIANVNVSSTTVTLNYGDATIKATVP